MQVITLTENLLTKLITSSTNRWKEQVKFEHNMNISKRLIEVLRSEVENVEGGGGSPVALGDVNLDWHDAADLQEELTALIAINGQDELVVNLL